MWATHAYKQQQQYAMISPPMVGPPPAQLGLEEIRKKRSNSSSFATGASRIISACSSIFTLTSSMSDSGNEAVGTISVWVHEGYGGG